MFVVILSILLFLFILTIVVIIHEAGHFFAAKKFGIKVEEFAFGFPPRALSIKKGETEYSINWLPLGGYVKLYGEDDAGGGKISLNDKGLTIKDKKDLSRTFFARPAWQKALVILAGVSMNAILAFVIFYIFLFAMNFHTELPLIAKYNFFLVNQKVNSKIIITGIAKNSPAEKAGITQMSEIIGVNDKKISFNLDFTSQVNMNKGKKIKLEWLDKNKKDHVSIVVPRVSPPKGQGALGLMLAPFQTVDLSYDTFTQKLLSGVTHPLNMLFYSFAAIGKFASLAVQEKSIAPVGENLSGPIGIFVGVGSIIEFSPNLKDLILQMLNLAGLISISLAFFNVLPIPALDGGRLFFILIELVSGKKVNSKLEGTIHSIGMIVLLALVVGITVFFDLPKLAQFLSFTFAKH